MAVASHLKSIIIRSMKTAVIGTDNLIIANLRQNKVLNTNTKRYQETEHIAVLNLRNPTSRREYKDSLVWLEEFRTECNKTGKP